MTRIDPRPATAATPARVRVAFYSHTPPVKRSRWARFVGAVRRVFPW